MKRYAEHTKVPIEKTKATIENTLRKAQATGFMFATDDDRGLSVVQFRIDERMVRLMVVAPDVAEFTNSYSPETACQQEHRRRWRALLLIIKAKLELVMSGESTIEREFLADILLPDGTTVGEAMLPRIAEAYESGDMPRLLLPSAP